MVLAILAALGAIVGALVDAGKAVLDWMMSALQTIFSMLQSFVQSAPTPMKVAIFMLFLLTIANVFSSFFISVRYACDGSNNLYETENIGSAFLLMVKTQFQDISTIDRDTFITDNFNPITSPPSPTHIVCISSSPKLYFYSIDIFNYKMWLLLLVLLFGAPMVWNYYSRMGALK